MKQRFFSVLLAISFGFTAAPLFALDQAEFSADMVSRTAQGVVQGKTYAAKQKTRFEMGSSVIITRLDKQVAWVLMPDQGMYMEQAIDPNAAAKASKEIPGEISRVLIGVDPYDGKPTEKYQITYTVNGRTEAIYQWALADSFMPLKVAAVDGSWSVEYHNIQTGPQPDALFEVPPGLKKFQLPDMSQMGLARGGQGQVNMQAMMQQAQDQMGADSSADDQESQN